MMEIGPFGLSDVENIKQLLESKSILYEMVIDKEAEERILAEYHAKTSSSPKSNAGTLDLKIIYFEINEASFIKVSKELENYGISSPSDGSFEFGDD